MPKLVNHEERKALIADAVFALVKESGIENLTIRKIAKEAGLTIGGVQYYFSTQKELYIYAMETILKRNEERIFNAVREGDAPLEAVVTLLKQLVALEDENHRLEVEAWLQFGLMSQKYSELNKFNDRIRVSTEEFIKELLEILSNHHLLRKDVDKASKVSQLYIFMDGLTLQSVLYPDQYSDKIIEDSIRNYLNHILKDT